MSSAPSQNPPILRFDELDPTPLAGEGNLVWRIPYGDEQVVLKVYEGSRSRFLYWKKTFGNVYVTGRSSHMPRARCAVEIDCLNTWESHGFRCFPMRPEITVEGLARDVYMIYDYVPGVHFREHFKDKSIPLEDRYATWRRFIPEWYRRHRIAVDNNDRRLIHENGDVKHVMLWEDDLVYFDFEMIFTRGDIRMLVGREIVAYMRSVGRFFGREMYERMTDDLVELYPDKALLLAAWEQAFRNTNPVMRLARRIHRFNPATRKPFSKYTVALDIARRLRGAALN